MQHGLVAVRQIRGDLVYIIAVIHNHVCFWSYPKLFMALEPAQVMLERLKAHGKKSIEIYEVMELKKITGDELAN